MRISPRILLIVGLLLLAYSFAGELDATRFATLCLGMAAIVLSFLMFGTAKDRSHQIAEADPARQKEERNKCGPREVLGEFMGGVGLLLIMVPFYWLLFSDSYKPGLSTAGIFLIGVALVYCCVLLERPPKSRPPYWWPAISGMICSGCTLGFLAFGIYVARTPEKDILSWVIVMIFLLAVASAVSAITCLGSGLGMMVKSKSKPKERVPPQAVEG